MDTTLASPASVNVGSAEPVRLADRLQAMPRRNQLGLGIGLLLIIGVLIALSMWSRTGDYRPVFTGLSDKDGGAVIAQLAQMQVPYKSEPGGMILVPATQVHDVRMKLASAGLPKGNHTGFELLDKPSMGQTQFGERLNYQRALEGELIRTITSLADVTDARVHLAIPQQTGFFREQQQPSASVMVHVRGGRTLDRAQVAGIVHLVSASVAELKPHQVNVLDQSGTLLNSPNNQDAQLGLSDHHRQHQHEMESRLAQRVHALLEPIVGAGNVRATVTAEIDFSQVEHVEESHEPNHTGEPHALRSHVIQEHHGDSKDTPTGVPGAIANQPPAQAAAPINGASAPLQGAQQGQAGTLRQRHETRNFELNRLVKNTKQASGKVMRLSTALVLNHRTKTDVKGKQSAEAIPAEEMQRLTQLVKEAIGHSEKRGDTISVISSPFLAPEVKTIDLPLWQQPWARDLVGSGAVPLALVLVALIVVFGMVRPAIKAAYPEEPKDLVKVVPAGAQLSEVVGDTPLLEAPKDELGLPALEAPIDATKLERARMLAQANPLAVANIVRAWMNGEEPVVG